MQSGLDRILERPEQGTVDPDRHRTVRMRRFPSSIHNRIERTAIVFSAIMFGGR
jgi:hypothetical protein